jgi:hypothetical protein
LMILLRRLTGRALLLALLALPMLAGSAAAASIGESGATLTLDAPGWGGMGHSFDIRSYTDPTTNSPMVEVYDWVGGVPVGQGCSASEAGEVMTCDASGLSSIVIDESLVSAQVSYTTLGGTTPLPMTVNYAYNPFSDPGAGASFTETPAGQHVGAWDYGGTPAGTTIAAPITINDEAPVGASLYVNAGDGHATINGGNAQATFTLGSGGGTITTGSQPTTIFAQNHVVDDIVCNSDQDIVHADPEDVITGTCGTIDTGGPPTAALTAIDSTPLTGQQVTFDASGSTDPARTITDYSWNFDGTGFATDTSSTPTASHIYTTPGDYSASVRITDNAGETAVQSMAVHVTPAPPAGTVSVSIDDGLIATSDPNVTLDLVWPVGATSAMISNDGGFGASGTTETVPLSPTVSWTLESSGPERLPKTVYVRFLGAGSDNIPYTDDIILDQTVPVIASAQLTDTPGGATANIASMPNVQLSASDGISGITMVQFANSSSTVTDALVTANTLGQYTVEQAISVDLAAPTRVRVQNAAGTWSAWSGITQASVPSPTGHAPVRTAARHRCVVPRLTGKTLAQAKKLLARAHCVLGAVKKPKRARHVLRVKWQSLRPGATYAAGHRVSATMS